MLLDYVQYQCAACPAGSYCARGSSSGTSSTCPAGHYCPVGTPATDSYPCPAGTYSGAMGLVDASGCMACTVGSYCPQGSTFPTSCGVGTYNPYTSSAEASACLACEAGWACPSTGMWEMTTRWHETYVCMGDRERQRGWGIIREIIVTRSDPSCGYHTTTSVVHPETLQ